MSESLVGLNVAATRQNAGSALSAAFCSAAPRPPPGNVKDPAATDCAKVIVALGSAS